MEVLPRYQVIQESYEEYLIRNIYLGLFWSSFWISFKVLAIFSVFGVGSVSWIWVDWSLCLFCLRSSVNSELSQHWNHPFWPHQPVSQRLPDWGVCEPSSVCLCHGSIYCTSVPACHKCVSMPEGHLWSDCASQDMPEVPDALKGLDVVPLCQMAQDYLWHNICLWWWQYVFYPHVMAFWAWELFY